MIPRAARRSDRVEAAGLMRVAPGYVNRRTDDERPEPFLVRVPSGGLSLRAAWSSAASCALESGDDRRGAVSVACDALLDAYEATGLTAVDEWRPGSGLSLLDQAALAGAALGYLDVPDFELGEGLAAATVTRNDDGILVVTPPTPAALRAAAAAVTVPVLLPEEIRLDLAPAPAPAPRPNPVPEPAPRPAAAQTPSPAPAFTRPRRPGAGRLVATTF